jgi:mRNA-degrading endonuclease RelE of RelBE toxin-antitoxin system
MKIINILFDDQFEKQFQKYKEKLTPKQREKLKQKLEIFKEDIFDNSLKTHKLS